MVVELGRPTELLPRNKFKPLSLPVFLLMWFKKKSLFHLTTLWSSFIAEGTQGRSSKGQEPRGSSKSRSHGEVLFIGLLSIDCWTCLFHGAEDYQPRGGTSHSESAPPMSIANQENTSQVYTQVRMVGLCSQLRLLLPKWLWLVSSWQKS